MPQQQYQERQTPPQYKPAKASIQAPQVPQQYPADVKTMPQPQHREKASNPYAPASQGQQSQLWMQRAFLPGNSLQGENAIPVVQTNIPVQQQLVNQEGYFSTQYQAHLLVQTLQPSPSQAISFPPPPHAAQNQGIELHQQSTTSQHFLPPPGVDQSQVSHSPVSPQLPSQGVSFPPPPPPLPSTVQNQAHQIPEQATTPQHFPPLLVADQSQVSRPPQLATTELYFPPPPPYQPAQAKNQHINSPGQLPPRPSLTLNAYEDSKRQDRPQAAAPGYYFPPPPPLPPRATTPQPTIEKDPHTVMGRMVDKTQAFSTKLSNKIEHYVHPNNPETKEEKKPWDERTDEEKHASYKKLGKRAAIGAGAVVAVVIGVEAIEAVSSVGGCANAASSANNVVSAVNLAAMNEAANAIMIAALP
jgi:hypothetical protein